MNKIKTLVFIVITFLISNYVMAQTVDITPMYGYQLNGAIKYVEGKLDMKDAQMVGGTIDFMVADGMGIRLMYSYNKSNANFSPYYGYENSFPFRNFEVINDYYQIGTIKGFVRDKIEPYGVFTLGAARYKGEGDVATDSRWKFAITAGLGTKIFFNERIGIKLEGNFMMPIYFAGVGFYFGTGGSGTSVNGAVPLLQGNFNGGLVIRLAK